TLFRSHRFGDRLRRRNRRSRRTGPLHRSRITLGGPHRPSRPPRGHHRGRRPTVRAPMTLALVLGGTRSGKSREAERLVTAFADGAPVTYLATARVDGDPALDDRITAHRLRRPAHWRTIEAGDDLPDLLLRLEGPVLLDAIGPWVAGRWPDQPDVDGLT